MTSSPSSASSSPLIVFDLGGVILQICRSWGEGCERAGVTSREAPDLPRIEDTWAAVGSRYERGEITLDEFARGTSEALDGRYSPEEIARVHTHWIHGPYDTAAAMIDRLHAAGLSTSCLSNTSHDHWITMPQWDAFARIQQRFGSHILGLAKPDEAIFRAFESAVDRAPSELIFFEDTDRNAKAARACGWEAVVVDPLNDPPAQVAAELASRGLI